jgi:hypothetical protein
MKLHQYFRGGLILLALVANSPHPAGAADEDQGVWVAVGYGGRRMVSTDGKKWEITAEWAQPGGDDSNNLMGLVFAQGKFVAVGGGGAGKTGGGHILVSRDGRKWTEVHTAKNRINPIVFANDRFVVGGPDRQLHWSADGEKWKAGGTIEAKEATHFRHGAFGNGVFVFVGNHGGNGGPFWCATSADGEKITNVRTDMPSIRAIAFGAGRFVIVGEDGVRTTSADGMTWEANDTDKSEKLGWVIWNGREFLTAGKKVYASPDGKTWKAVERKFQGHPLWTDGKRFVSTAWPGQMYFSADGTAWDKGPALTANGINKVAYGVPSK